MHLKTVTATLLLLAILLGLTACTQADPAPSTAAPEQTQGSEDVQAEITDIVLSDSGVVCDSDAVYTANDIIYYEAGHDETYGAGDETDAHSAEEADAHTVVHITQPGTYRVTGTLSAGQIFVDLGENAKEDENARVTLILDDVDISCTVAPAIFFYRVYECGDAETYVPEPDLTNAGAVVELAADTTNLVNGSYVAKIYKEGTEKKLHKYDAAFYSCASMRIGGEGALVIEGENEGLDSELHLQIDSGSITIGSQDDGINTNEDGISVTTINGGSLYISAGLGSEGDGIDSNGALVINGGYVYSMANPRSGDGGLDADVDIRINGGTVIASGSRNDDVSADSEQVLLSLSFAQTVREGSVFSLTDPEGEEVLAFASERDYSALVVSAPTLSLDTAYSLYLDGTLYQHGGMAEFGPIGGDRPQDMEPPEGMESPEDMPERPEGMENPGEMPEPPEGMENPGELPEPPEGMENPGELQEPPEGMEEPPEGFGGGMGGRFEDGSISTEVSTEFVVTAENHNFYHVSPTGESIK